MYWYVDLRRAVDIIRLRVHIIQKRLREAETRLLNLPTYFTPPLLYIHKHDDMTFFFPFILLGRLHYRRTYVLNVVAHLVYWKSKSF